jgi:hypothetical protein
MALVPMDFLKGLPFAFYEVYAEFLNVMLRHGVPPSWNMLALTPVSKRKGSASDPNNYRGIAVMSPHAKVFATLLLNRVEATAVSKNLRASS